MTKKPRFSLPSEAEEKEMRKFLETHDKREALNKETHHLLCFCDSVREKFPHLCSTRVSPPRFVFIAQEVLKKIDQEQRPATRPTGQRIAA